MTASKTDDRLASTSTARAYRARQRGCAAALGLAAALLGGCYDPGNGIEVRRPDMVFIVPNSDLSATIRDADGDFVSEVDAVHVVGGSSCPQSLATVSIDNEGDAPAVATLEFVDAPPPSIELSAATVEIPAGGSADIDIAFNCASTDDVEVLMDLSIEVDGRVSLFEVPLALDVTM